MHTSHNAFACMSLHLLLLLPRTSHRILSSIYGLRLPKRQKEHTWLGVRTKSYEHNYILHPSQSILDLMSCFLLLVKKEGAILQTLRHNWLPGSQTWAAWRTYYWLSEFGMYLQVKVYWLMIVYLNQQKDVEFKISFWNGDMSGKVNVFSMQQWHTLSLISWRV